MCFLNDEGAFRGHGRTFDQECTYFLYCGLTQRVLANISQAESHSGIDESNRKDWKYLTFIRDPVDRFLSAYVEKCIGSSNAALDYCYGCGYNLTCFLSTLYERTYRRPKEVSFKESVADRHYVPQNWVCGFSSSLSKYTLIRYSSDTEYQEGIRDRLAEVLRGQNVSETSIAFIREQLGGGKTHHASKHAPARAFYENLLRTNQHLMEYIVRIFYWDFVLFGYELPRHFLNYHEPNSNER
ncbi:Protein SEB-3 [Aphelenchoides avenae]|nr:Protein SEB-3 [Aphelenchus avenae]